MGESDRRLPSRPGGALIVALARTMRLGARTLPIILCVIGGILSIILIRSLISQPFSSTEARNQGALEDKEQSSAEHMLRRLNKLDEAQLRLQALVWRHQSYIQQAKQQTMEQSAVSEAENAQAKKLWGSDAASHKAKQEAAAPRKDADEAKEATEKAKQAEVSSKASEKKTEARLKQIAAKMEGEKAKQAVGLDTSPPPPAVLPPPLPAGKGARRLEPPPLLPATTTQAFKDALEAFLKAPELDLVITWLNSSNATWRSTMKSVPGPAIAKIDGSELYNPKNDSLVDTFIELKYALRSFEKHGLMKYVRKVFIVHSDLYSPPNYLNGEHDQLQFVKHSDMWLESTKSVGLPNFNRNAIDSNVHRIKGLGEWYLTAMDDQFLLKPFKWSHFIGPDGVRVCGKGGNGPHKKWGDGGYLGAMKTAAQLLETRFGVRSRTMSDHEPYLAWRPAREQMESLWPNQHIANAQTQFGAEKNIHLGCLYKNFVVDAQYGVHTVCGKWYTALHTNSRVCPRPCDGYKHDVKPAGIALMTKLMAEVVEFTWGNLQGPGFDDAYRFRPLVGNREYSPKLQNVVRKWLEEVYPTPSKFEKK